MKARGTTDQVAYPDVGHELVDLISQQPESLKAGGVAVRRERLDEYRAIVAATLSRLEQLTRQETPPLSSFGFVPRPSAWGSPQAIFRDPQMSQLLKSIVPALSSNSRLEELANDLVTDTETGALNIHHLLPKDFHGLTFPPDLTKDEQDPLEFTQERSVLSLDDLREILFHDSGNASQKASALLQFRAKLERLKNLGEWIQNSFAELDYLDASRVKGPLLC